MAKSPETLGLLQSHPSVPKASILLVDDNPANLLSLRALLDCLGQNLVEAHSGEEALQRVQTDEFAVVLLDVLMPGVSGFETAKAIRGHERSQHTPIIFLTASDIDRSQMEEAYALGAVDFLVKPVLPVALQAKVRGFVEIFQDKQRAKHEANQLRLLVEGATDYAIFLLDTEGHIVSWNPGAERIKGYKANEIIGQHFSRFYPQEAIDRGWPSHELKVAKAEGRFEDEGWRVRKDGTQFWANVIITALHDEAGHFVGYSKITRDLTERKRAEENARRLVEETTARRVAEENARIIQEQRERLHVTLASIGDAVISTDAEGRVDFLNPVAENLVGWRTEEAAHHTLDEVFRIVNEDTRQTVENPALRALKEGVIVGLANHTVLISKDGRERPIDDCAAPIRDAGGSVLGSVLVFRDISEKKAAENRLREQQEWLRVTLASIGDAVIATDTHGLVTFLNEVAEELTGWTQVDAQGQPLEAVFAILNEQTRQPIENPVEKVLRDGVIVGLGNHTVLIAKDGTERPIDDAAAPIRDAQGQLIGIVLTFRDVSEQRRAEQYRNVRLAVTQALSEAETVENGASGVLRAVCENLGWDVGFFWTVSEDENALVCRRSWHRTDVRVEEFETASCRRTFTKEEGLPGRVWASGEPAWILDIKQDANFQRLAVAVDYGLHSAFAYPVIVGDQMLGVIEFFTRRIRDAEANLLEMMGTVAGNLGQFIERKTAEIELRRSEQELADFFENATIGLHWVGPDGMILRANRAELDMLGYAREEYVGRPIAEFHADKDVICDILKRLQAGEKLTEYPARLVCKDGSIRDVLIDSSVLWRDGQFVHTRCFTRDVTERKRAEGALKASAERLNLALSAAALGNWSWDTASDVVTFSQRAGDIFGIPPGPHMTWTAMQKLLHEDDREQARRAVERAVAQRSQYDIEYRLNREDGTQVWVAALGRAIYDDTGKVQGMYGVVRDITDRKRAEEALRHSEERFRSLMEQAPFSIQVFSPDGRTIRVNRAWEELWGVRVEQIKDYNILADRQLESRGVLHFIHQGFAGQAARIPAIQYDPNETIPDITKEADPRRWLSAAIYPIKDADGKVREVVLIHEDITARKRAEEELQRSERQSRTILESITDAFCALDRNWRFTYVNRQAEVLLGRSRDDVIGKSHWDVYPDTLGTDLESGYRRAAAENITASLEHFYPPHNRWYEVHAYPSPEGLSVYFRDVSERRRAEAALRESEQRFRQLADSMPQIVWTARPDGKIDYLNRRWTEFTGLPDTVGNEGWAQILHPDEAQAANERWAASVQSGTPFEIELKLLDRRQTSRWHLIRTVPVHDDAGRVTRWFGTSTDIHEQKRAEESSRYLAEASAALASVVDYESTLQKVANLAVPYFADWSAVDMVNEDGSLRRLAVAHQDTNKIGLAHELMRQYPPDPQAPSGVFTVLRTGRPEIIGEITDDLLVQGAKDQRHLDLIRSLGLKSYICVPLVVSGNPLGALTFATAESGRRYTDADLALAVDLANRAAVAVENTQLYQALREADRRKDEFLATLAHELRNPLAPIRNALEILKMPRVEAQISERSREMMERQVHHLVRLVDDLLDVSRVMRGKIELRKERVELATVVARAVETVQPLLDSHGQELSVRLPPESLTLDADPVRLSQVIANLLTNAAKYTEPKGHIWLTAERDGDVVVLRVRDTGIGITRQMLARIFELFVQVDHASTKAQGGLGIGLTLVKNLVEMHNGTVEAHSEGLGKGSEFVVRLPLSAQGVGSDQNSSAEDQIHQPPSASGYRLLVVDDNQDAANSLAMLLKLQGHEVRVAFNGMTALELTKTYTPDVVFLDIGMPGMDGYEVARRLGKQPGLENVVLAAITGWGQREDRRRTEEAGFKHHLVKPPDPKALQGVLAELKKSKQ